MYYLYLILTFFTGTEDSVSTTKMQMATAAPEMHNMYEVFRDMYEALGVRDIDRILKRTPEPEAEPKDPASENIDALDMLPMVALKVKIMKLTMSHMVFGSTPLVAGTPQIAWLYRSILWIM